MKFILKFVENEKYAEDLMRGSLYMNPLSYFWNVKKGEPLGASNSDRYDIFEGTYLSLDKENICLDKEFVNVIGPNPIVRMSGYKYINLFSTFRAEFNIKSRELFIPAINTMNDFGKIVVVIMDESNFRYRIRRASEKLGYDCVFGDVNYHSANNRGKLVSGPMLHLIMEEEIDIHNLASEKNILCHYDCFDKWDKHAYQREWRICLNRNNKKATPYRLEIGSLSDIAFIVPVEMLHITLFRWLENITSENLLTYLPKYDGTITRDKFKENVYNLRPNKGYLLATIM